LKQATTFFEYFFLKVVSVLKKVGPFLGPRVGDALEGAGISEQVF